MTQAASRSTASRYRCRRSGLSRCSPFTNPSARSPDRSRQQRLSKAGHVEAGRPAQREVTNRPTSESRTTHRRYEAAGNRDERIRQVGHQPCVRACWHRDVELGEPLVGQLALDKRATITPIARPPHRARHPPRLPSARRGRRRRRARSCDGPSPGRGRGHCRRRRAGCRAGSHLKTPTLEHGGNRISAEMDSHPLDTSRTMKQSDSLRSGAQQGSGVFPGDPGRSRRDVIERVPLLIVPADTLVDSLHNPIRPILLLVDEEDRGGGYGSLYNHSFDAAPATARAGRDAEIRRRPRHRRRQLTISTSSDPNQTPVVSRW